MNVVERFAYATGRALGSAAREFLDTMWPAVDAQAAEAMTPDVSPAWGTASTHETGTPGEWASSYGCEGAGKIADIPVPPEGHKWKPVVNDGSQPVDARWSCSDPGRFQIAAQPSSMDEALDGVDDETQWFDWARPAIADVLDSGQWVPAEWVDTVSAIIAEKIAADPAKAIAALWNYQLSRNETT